jgi:hypothetical protein
MAKSGIIFLLGFSLIFSLACFGIVKGKVALNNAAL